MEHTSDTGKDMGILRQRSMVRAICGVHVRYRKRDGNFEDRYLCESSMWSTCQIQEKRWEF